ncbi:MAG: DUF885 domain-containing protein [Acidobacteriota bacterium]|nr:DUF885 domain-containing protein [Acidobacteriota bacterium]
MRYSKVLRNQDNTRTLNMPSKSRFGTRKLNALLPALLSLLAGCRNVSTAPSAGAAWDQYLAGYLESYFAAHPDVAVTSGRHEFDGKLPDFSRAANDREIARLHSERRRAAAFGNGLADNQKFERDYLLSSIDSDLFWLETAQWPYRNPYFYSNPIDPSVYLTRPYAPLDQRMRAFVEYERVLPVALRQVQTNLRIPMPRTWVDQGRLTFGGLAQYFQKDVPAIFTSVNDPTLQKDFSDSNREAIRVLTSLDQWFESQRASANDNFAIGAETFQKMLYATERVDLPLDRLQAVGRRDLDRNLAALKEACAQLTPGKSLEDCVAKMAADKPEGKPVEAARLQLTRLRDFVVAKNLVTIPGTEQALVDEAPPYMRWNFAYINIPGPYEKGLPSVYYISPPDPKWSAAEQKAYLPGKGTLLFTSAHEVMPGHFLQFLHANRSPSKFGRIFVGYAYAEGWAHYAEELIWDAGIDSGDPETRVGQLTEALLRNVRFLSAIGMHTGKMTVAESEKMFREMAFSDAGNARQQAARGTFDPAYLNYTMGKLMIMKLREDWTATRGGRNAWKDFHDQFLQFGGPPIPLVRSAMLGPNDGAPL